MGQTLKSSLANIFMDKGASTHANMESKLDVALSGWGFVSKQKGDNFGLRIGCIDAVGCIDAAEISTYLPGFVNPNLCANFTLAKKIETTLVLLVNIRRDRSS